MSSVPSQYKIQGADAAIERLKQLPLKLRKKYLGKALRAGATVVKKASVAKWRAIDDLRTPHKIWQNIAVRNNRRVGAAAGGLAMSVGVRGGAKKPYKNNKSNIRSGRAGKKYEPGSDVYYWRFLDLGTKKLAPKRLFESAFGESAEQAIDKFAETLNKGIDQAIGEL